MTVFRCRVCGQVYDEIPSRMTCTEQYCGGPVVEEDE